MPVQTQRPTPQPAATPAQPAAPAAKPAAGQERQTALRGMNYQQGRESVRPGGGAAGTGSEGQGAAAQGVGLPAVPASGAEAVQLAQKSVTGGSVGATLDSAQTAYQDCDIQVQFDAGSRLSASLGYGGLSFGAQPGILVKVNNAPDVRINQVRWNFAEARFTADVASDGFDLFGIIGKIGKWKVEKVLDQKLKPLLPPAIRQAGYSPQRDPYLTATIGQMQKMFEFSAGDAAGAAGGMAGKLSAPSAGLDVSMPDDLQVPLGDSGLELIIAKGTPIDLSAQGQGKAGNPTLERLSLRAGAKGIQIRPTSGVFKEFKEMDIRGVSVRAGGAFDFDYDLSAEGTIQGLAALGQLLGLAMGQPVSGNVPDVKLDSIRKEIDAKLQSEVPPRFKAFVQQYDGLVPGFSLKAFFGA